MSKHTMLTNCGHKLFSPGCSAIFNTKGSCGSLLLIKRQFTDQHRTSFTIQNDEMKGHRKPMFVSNFPFGGRISESAEGKHDLSGGADATTHEEVMEYLVKSLITFEKFYQEADRMSLEKRGDESIEERKVYNLIGRSHFGLAMMNELVRDSPLGLDEFASVHEAYLGALPRAGVAPDSNGVSLLDGPTMRQALWLWHLEKVISFGDQFTREKLIALFYLIIHHMWNREARYSLHYMRLFTEEYVKTKKLYTTILNNSLASSWSSVLGKVFTENEFDIFQDLESDLPVNLQSMYNIFGAFVSFADSDNVPVDLYLKKLDEEQLNNPLNPYIPYMKVMMEDQFGEIDTVLKLLEKSSIGKQEFTHWDRIDFCDIFSNTKSESMKRVPDFTFFPVLYWKAYSLNEQSPSYTSELSHYCDQLEYFSSMSSHCKLLNLKISKEYSQGNYERALEIFEFSEKYYHTLIKLEEDYSLTYYGSHTLTKLGRKEEAQQLIKKKINRYGSLDTLFFFRDLLSQLK